MKLKHLAFLILLTSCQSGGGNSETVTQNILNCQSYGDVTETIFTTTNNEAPAEELPADETTSTDVQQDNTSSSAQTDTDPLAGISPVVPGLNTGTVKSLVDTTDAELERCESEATCVVLGFYRGKALVEHCVGIEFPGVEL